MLIDWFTVGAQVLNFIILVWLMKRFLYQPVLNAIAAREQKIAAELADAADTKAKAHQQQIEYQEKNQTFDQQRADLLQQAKEDASAEAERLRAGAAEAAEQAKTKRAKALATETQQLHAEIVQQTQQQAFEIARRVLADLADASLEQRACEIFIQRLQTMEDDALATLGGALKTTSDADPALLRSAFELPETQRAAIQSALNDKLGQSVALRYETNPGLVAGIELSSNGQKLAWSIADYLRALAVSPPPATAEPDTTEPA